MSEEDILKFAKREGYDEISYIGKWRGYEVYEPMFESEESINIGLPYIILVKEDEIRMSTPEESLEQLNEMN
jgi:hypothetical protein